MNVIDEQLRDMLGDKLFYKLFMKIFVQESKQTGMTQVATNEQLNLVLRSCNKKPVDLNVIKRLWNN
ncbi:hypothetical protein V7146_11505 [Gottfriedia acidiceleris]|uniref:hypothetical protein n=1 Tax=Gottfriedia acidiceleris TaxID=371036 RepID=UPI0030009224